jgi:REP element-mobilizing transposase RayT
MNSACDRHWLLTWTTYGTWLPGDERGFVSPVPQERGKRILHNVRGSQYDQDIPRLRKESRRLLKGPPVFLQLPHAEVLLAQFQETSAHRFWTPIAVAVMRAHIHVFVGVPGDPDPEDLLRDFKAYGSRALNRQFSRPKSGTWWTESGSKRVKRTEDSMVKAVRYVAGQENPLLVWVHPDWRWALAQA